MKIVLAHFNTAKEVWHSEATSLYIKKISQFASFEVVSLKTKKLSRDSAEAKKGAEAESLSSFVTGSDILVLFDERGTDLDSIGFSKKLNQWLISGKKRLVFCIGGAYGFDQSAKERADFKISLSKMTMNHLVAEIMAMEQVYRGFAILRNLPYHNE